MRLERCRWLPGSGVFSSSSNVPSGLVWKPPSCFAVETQSAEALASPEAAAISASVRKSILMLVRS